MKKFILLGLAIWMAVCILTADANAQTRNPKIRARADVATADLSNPTTSSNFTSMLGSFNKPASYIELSVKFTGVTACTIQPWFLEDQTTGQDSYVVSGSNIDLSATGGSTVIIPGANGRAVYIKVIDITGVGTIDIDIGAGLVQPGVNAL